MFHISLLKPYHLNKMTGREELRPPPIGIITEDGETTEEWEVEEILKSRIQ